MRLTLLTVLFLAGTALAAPDRECRVDFCNEAELTALCNRPLCPAPVCPTPVCNVSCPPAPTPARVLRETCRRVKAGLRCTRRTLE